MAEFRTGTELIKAATEKKGSKRFSPSIYWKKGDVRTVVFTTAAEDIAKVRLHEFVKVPNDSEKGFSYQTFLCHKDPSMVESSGGTCDLCDRVGHTARERYTALAVEVEPAKTEGKRVTAYKVLYNVVKRDDGTEVEYPRWGLVTQAAGNFFAFLAAFDEKKGDIRERIFEIQREGDDTQTKYHFFTEDAPVPEDVAKVVEEMPTLVDLLTEMGSDEKYSSLKVVEAGSQEQYENDTSATKSNQANSDKQAIFDKLKEDLATKSTVSEY